MLSLRDLEAEGRAIVQQARDEAARLIAQARAAAEQQGAQVREQMHAQGLAEGRAAGFERARQDAATSALNEARAGLERLAQALTHAAQNFEREKRAMLAAAEAGVIRLALAVAERVCKTQAAASSAAALANARQALELVAHEHDPVLHVNPADLAAAQAGLPEWLAQLQPLEHVQIVADERVGPGGCAVRTRTGTLDATLDVQLDRVAAALLAGDVDAGAADVTAGAADVNAGAADVNAAAADAASPDSAGEPPDAGASA